MAVQQNLEIPRIIHRIWLDDPVPESMAKWGESWAALNPGWKVRNWLSSREVNERRLPGYLIRAQAKEVIPKDWKRFQADVLRLELLYEYGGLYVDMDVEPHAAIESLLEGRRCLVARSPQTDTHGYHAITNCVMAAVPKHPWVKALIVGLGDAVMNYSQSHLARMIGPWHLDRTYSSGEWPDVDVLNWNDMTPWLTHYWNNRRRQRGEGLT